MPRKKTISDEELLAVACEVFVERGFTASTREIARRAGVSEALLFQRFTTKADLFFAAMVPPSGAIDQRLQQVHAAADLYAALEELAFALLDYFRGAQPVLEPLMSHPDFKLEEFARRFPENPMVNLRWQVMEFFRLNRSPDPAGAALLLLGTMRSVASFERLGAHGGKFDPEIIRRTVRTLWNGVRPAQPQAPQQP